MTRKNFVVKLEHRALGVSGVNHEIYALVKFSIIRPHPDMRRRPKLRPRLTQIPQDFLRQFRQRIDTPFDVADLAEDFFFLVRLQRHITPA